MNNIKVKKLQSFSSITIFSFVLGMLFMPCYAITLRAIEDTTTFDLPEGFSRIKIISNTELNKGQIVATFFKMDNIPSCKIKFVSRKNFEGTFDFNNIEQQCVQNGEQIVLQVAAAFTPDWKVIEGFALEDGEKVGQDSYLGENRELYKGILLIKDGKPLITYIDNIIDRDVFIAESVHDSCSMFQQVAAIIESKINRNFDLPGVCKRRFFVEVIEENQSSFGIVNFNIEMRYSDAVKVLTEMESQDFKVHNALYLDMGAVSEGYFYDAQGQKHLMGDPDKDILNYTNVLIMYKDLRSE